MTSNLDTLITTAKDLARSGKRREAMKLAKELVEKNPGEARVWSSRAFLHALNRDYSAAVADLGRAIEIGPAEPSCSSTADPITSGLATISLRSMILVNDSIFASPAAMTFTARHCTSGALRRP